MAQNDRSMGIKYQPMVDEGKDPSSHSCDVRPDESGFWNMCKAWYLIFLHLATCVILLLCLEYLVDEQDFRIGSPSLLFTLPLYQAQVTGLISFSLVLIRMLAGACSTMIAWRTASVMLNGEGVTLKELVRLGNYRMPTFPQGGLGNHLLWSSWAAVVIILTWPSVFASPLATSAVTWNPETKLSSTSHEIQTQIMDGSDWDFLIYPDKISRIIISAASIAGTDPKYAFDPAGMTLRRYFSSTQEIPANSSIDITVPYFNVDLHWINGADDSRLQHVGDRNYSDILTPDINWRGDGSVSVLRSSTWNTSLARPTVKEVFSAQKLVSVKVTTLDINVPLPDNSTASQDMACPATSLSLGKLPNVTQREEQYYLTDNQWAGKDCFVVAEVSITAGNYQGKSCTVNPAGRNIYSATCTIQTSHDAVKADWLSRLSVDFMSEIIRNIVMLNNSPSWIHDNLQVFVTGMLHLAYDATWSSITNYLGTDEESVTVRLAEPVIRARVESSKLFIWLSMCSTMTLSALLLSLGLMLSSTKTIRDPTLAALSMDLSEVAHSGRTSGLCNAVALSEEDKKLPKLKFANDDDGKGFDKCRRRLIFADRIEKAPMNPHES